MSEYPQLNQPPVVEAILDVQGTFPKEVELESFAKLTESFKGDYPKRTEDTFFEFAFEHQAGQEPKARAGACGLRGYRYHSLDEKDIIQCRKDGFTFNRLKPYTAWEDVYPKAVKTWGVFRRAFPEMIIRRISLRYINQIFLPPIDDLAKLDDYLAIQIPGPKKIADFTRATFMGQSIFVDKESGLAANYVVTHQTGGDPSKIYVLLDIEVFYIEPDVSESEPAALWPKMRNLKNKLFFASLQPKGIELFQ
jgi:uncharacterized protein (TIGR04255 family)